MQFRILGPVEVLADDGQVLLPGPTERQLLAVLLSHAGQVVSTDRLADAVWGDDVPANPRNALQARVSRLRRLLGDDAITTRAPGYLVDPAAERLDARQFEQLLAAGRAATDPHERRALLGEALALWRGPALADLAHEDFARAEAERLDALRLDAVEARLDARLELGEHNEVVVELDALVAEHPLREGLTRRLMLALYRAGRQGDALQVYRDTRRRLDDELGVAPGPDLMALEAAILRQDPSLLPPSPPPALSFPTPLTSFVGRQQELLDVARALSWSRLVTLVGPGGVGKTRLAVEVVAAAPAAGAPDPAAASPAVVANAASPAVAANAAVYPGVTAIERGFVDLAAVTAGRVLAEFGSALRLDRGLPGLVGPAAPDPVETLVAHLRGRDVLLVVDNCEHVIDEVAGIVETLLTRLGELRILATSRERLGVPGETVVPVSPLPTTVDAPGATSSDADTLFVWRAREVDPGFDSTRAAQVIADICARLDGIPLAIELAAARTRSLSVADIAARLDDRFRVLAGTRRTTATRQRTLRAAIDWSYELLAPPERLVLQRVALLASSFDLATAEAVAGGDDLAPEDVADALGRLVEQSMVVAESGASPRYRLLETIRAYALDRLAAAGAGATEATGRRLVDHYTELVSMADPKLRTAEQPAWLDRLTTEYDNITAALERAWSIDPGAAVRLTGRLTWFWHLRAMFDEAGRWLEPALALPADGHEHAMAEVNLAASILSRHSPLSAEGRAFIATALDLARTSGNAPVEGRALTMTGALEMAVDPAAGLATIATAREIFETAGEPWGVALNWYVASVASRGDVHAARQYAEAALAIFEQTGDPWGTALAEQALGACLRTLGDYAAAAQIYASALRRARGIGAFREATAHTELATVAILQGDHAAAARHLAAGSHLAERYPTSAATGAALDAAGFLARRTGRYDDAIAHHTRALTINRDWQLAHGIAYSLSSLALAEELVGRLDSARAHHLEGLAVARQLGDDLAVAFALEGLAAVAAAGGVDAARAATLLGAAHRLRADRGVPLPPGADLDAGRAREAAVVQLGQPRFDLAFAEGLALQAEEIERVAAAE